MLSLFTNQIYRGVNGGVKVIIQLGEQKLQAYRESANRRTKITASAGENQRKNRAKRGASHEEKASVVIHFEDTALDDAHVSVPHNLMSEGQGKRGRRRVNNK